MSEAIQKKEAGRAIGLGTVRRQGGLGRPLCEEMELRCVAGKEPPWRYLVGEYSREGAEQVPRP